MEILQSISLDFGKDTEPVVVFAKQGDVNTRYVEITPLNNGKKYIPESGITARLHITKPDNKIVLSDASIEPSTGVIRAELTKQALAVAGMAVAEIGLYKGEALLTSQLFGIRIGKKAYSDNAAESSDDYKSLVNALSKVDPAVKLAESAAAEAKTQAKAAADKAAEAAGAVSDAKAAAKAATDAASAANTAKAETEAATKENKEATAAAKSAAEAALQAVKDAQTVINQAVDLAFFIDPEDGGLNVRILKEGY